MELYVVTTATTNDRLCAIKFVSFLQFNKYKTHSTNTKQTLLVWSLPYNFYTAVNISYLSQEYTSLT